MAPARSQELEHLIVNAIRDLFGYSLRPNQLQVGHALTHPCIAELATGEGKTLAAILPLAFWALQKQGVFLSTANDYLAQRDARLTACIFERLGLSVGYVQDGQTIQERRAAYACDVTYGTIREFGFDFLRDASQSQNTNPLVATLCPRPPLQRSPFALIVDEADCLLIDEARTPLILSGPGTGLLAAQESCYRWCAAVAPDFDQGEHYALLPVSGEVALTASGKSKLLSMKMPPGIHSLTLTEILHGLERAIYVNHIYRPSHHYIVQDSRVCIVDEYTGRIHEGRTWNDGIHQAIEAREQLPLSPPTQALAQISVQDFVKRFQHLSGLTGTAWEAKEEFQRVYGLPVQTFASHFPTQRLIYPTAVCRDRETKWSKIVAETQALLTKGRAILIGTRSIPASQAVASALRGTGIDCSVLNATNPHEEAAIIARSGIESTVTVATNMAGRGTDIAISNTVKAAGGLHVVATELHAAKRIDRQLEGRCARQGDPGSFRQYIALDDEILSTAWGETKAQAIRQKWAQTQQLEGAESIFRAAQDTITSRQQAERELMSRHNESLREIYQQLGLNDTLDRIK